MPKVQTLAAVLRSRPLLLFEHSYSAEGTDYTVHYGLNML